MSRAYCKFCGKQIREQAKCGALICPECCNECNISDFDGQCLHVDKKEEGDEEE
jgi:hypothetical protein